jgi:hypothetical protein
MKQTPAAVPIEDEPVRKGASRKPAGSRRHPLGKTNTARGSIKIRGPAGRDRATLNAVLMLAPYDALHDEHAK